MTKLRLMIPSEELNHVRILDKEGNPFFKVVEKKQKKQKTLKAKAVPFSEAKPRKRQRIDEVNETSFIE